MLVSSVWDIELLQKNRSAKSQRRGKAGRDAGGMQRPVCGRGKGVSGNTEVKKALENAEELAQPDKRGLDRCLEWKDAVKAE